MKRIISVFLSVVIIVISTLYLGISAIAGEYISQIKAFVYNGYEIPEYDGDLCEIINNNNPKFTSRELNQTIYESYSPLDSLGRVGVCSANIDQTLMPTEPRGDISSVYPTGWKQNKYDFVPNGWLYNRSHLIGFQLTGENANKQNLMTGTRSFNATGMLEYENMVASYVKANKENNVVYRVTPVFRDNNLLANGVIMEAESVDDLGASVKFCVFVYNVQAGVSIDYETGDNMATDELSSKIDISKADISIASCTYTGKAVKPSVKITYNGYPLTKNNDYTLYYENNINAGKAKVTISGIGKYKGAITKNFTIGKAKYTPTIKSVEYTYNGNPHYVYMSGIKAGSTIKYKTSKSASYTTKKPTRTSVGKTTVYYSITNPNYLSISSSKTITILPKNTSSLYLTATNRGFKASWSKQATQTTGYQLRYSTSSNMANSKTVTITSNKTTSKAFKSLQGGKKYYVQIRTYKTIGKTKYYSSWSNAKYVTTKK